MTYISYIREFMCESCVAFDWQTVNTHIDGTVCADRYVSTLLVLTIPSSTRYIGNITLAGCSFSLYQFELVV